MLGALKSAPMSFELTNKKKYPPLSGRATPRFSQKICYTSGRSVDHCVQSVGQSLRLSRDMGQNFHRPLRNARGVDRACLL